MIARTAAQAPPLSLALGLLFLWRVPCQQCVQPVQYDAHCHGGVCDVERRVVPAIPIEEKEIDDVAVQRAVYGVAGAAAEHKRQGEASDAARRLAVEQPGDAESRA